MNMFGDVYLRCPLSGETVWFDWMSYDDFRRRYSNDTNFLWVS